MSVLSPGFVLDRFFNTNTLHNHTHQRDEIIFCFFYVCCRHSTISWNLSVSSVVVWNMRSHQSRMHGKYKTIYLNGKHEEITVFDIIARVCIAAKKYENNNNKKWNAFSCFRLWVSDAWTFFAVLFCFTTNEQFQVVAKWWMKSGNNIEEQGERCFSRKLHIKTSRWRKRRFRENRFDVVEQFYFILDLNWRLKYSSVLLA